MRIDAESFSLLQANEHIPALHDMARHNGSWLSGSPYADVGTRYGTSITRAAAAYLLRQSGRGRVRHFMLQAQGNGHSYSVGMARIVRDREMGYRREGVDRVLHGSYVDYWVAKQWQNKDTVHQAAAKAVMSQLVRLNERDPIEGQPDTAFAVLRRGVAHQPFGFVRGEEESAFTLCGEIDPNKVQRRLFSSSPDPYGLTKGAGPDNPYQLYTFAPASEYPTSPL